MRIATEILDSLDILGEGDDIPEDNWTSDYNKDRDGDGINDDFDWEKYRLDDTN